MVDDMATKVTMQKTIVLGPNTNVEKFVKKGQLVKTGDPLMVFEEVYEDSSIADILQSLGDDFSQNIQELSSSIVKSKYTGEIVDIKVYYNVDKDEMTPSLKRIVNSYESKQIKKKNILSQLSEKNGSVSSQIPVTGKLNSDKIKGTDVDGVMIEVYIEYYDNLAIGDRKLLSSLILN